MKIADRDIFQGPPYIISEIGGNHAGDLDKALKLIDVAKDAGADAVKFQCFTPDTITLDCDKPDFVVQAGPWKGRRLYDLYRSTHTPYDWFKVLFDHAKERQITAFASVFDKTSIDLLEGLGCPCYKIASFEITDIPLIRYATSTGKPLIISTGMAHEDEILEAYAAAGNDVVLLHCISGYPTPIEESGLHKISDLWWLLSNRGVVDPCIGISDHTLGSAIPMAATALGARIIEKHLCLPASHYEREKPEDFHFSMTPLAFLNMVTDVKDVWQAMQPHEAKSEESSRQARRSLYVVKDTKKGEIFTQESVRSIRPAFGLAPKHLDEVLGKRATQDVERGTALSWSLVDRTS